MLFVYLKKSKKKVIYVISHDSFISFHLCYVNLGVPIKLGQFGSFRERERTSSFI